MQERRLIHWQMKLGENFRHLGSELKEDANTVIGKKNPIDWVLGAGATAISGLSQGINKTILGVLGSEDPPVQGSRTAHTTREIWNDITSVRPLGAIYRMLQLPEALVVDIARGIGGLQKGTRNAVHRVLSR